MEFRSSLLKFGAGLLAVATTATVLPAASAADTPTKVDGKTSATAAASCYEIKQNDPTSKSGSYWLYTPQMDAPAQFYCDQETNGGGWVMIGRGRDGWTEDYVGKGKAEDLASNPDGTDAFSPVQLPSTTVDALLGGKPVNQLSDGVRFARSLNATGTATQNVYAKRARQSQWSWALRAKQQWDNITFDNPSGYPSDYTQDTNLGNLAWFDNRYYRMDFTTASSYSWKLGFIYGSYVTGSNSASSYLWSNTNGAGSPMAFTQVYMRPQLTQADLGTQQIADTGAAGSSKRALPNSYSAAWKWRTSEQTGSGATGEMNTYIQAFTQVGNTVFTGGDFKNLNSKSGETVEQSYLAGYDVNTSELVRSFMPKLNGQVKALQALPNGKLAVGGDFTEVNGEHVNNFVVLDPTTGAIDKTWNWDIANRTTGGVTQVKAMTVQGDYLYIAGNFTHVKGNTSDVYTFSRNAARFNLKTGSVDWKWRPNFNGTVNGITAAADGSSVHTAGYFSTLNGKEAWKLAALNSTDGQMLAPWNWQLSYSTKEASPRTGFQFDVEDAGDTVFAGGAEHLISQYAKGSYARLNSSITKSGGDFQDLTINNGVIYGSCHCGDFVYERGQTYMSPWTENDNVYSIRLTGAFDAQTGNVIPEFNPNVSGKSGFGIWANFVDSTGTLWVGGDINKSLGANGVQPTVGFARFSPRDVTAPGTPANLQVTTENDTDKLSWGASAKGSTYQILRGDRVIGTSTTTSFEVPHVNGGRYFVRAVDQAGNYSATTAVAVAPTIAPDQDPVPAPDPVDPAPADAFTGDLIAAGSDWDYQSEINEFDTTWKNLDSTTTGWKHGNAPIGWGDPSVKTTVDTTADGMPISVQMRKEFTLDSAVPANKKLVLTTRADDGVVVYVNGQEVGRQNLVQNPNPRRIADSAVDTQFAVENPLVIDVPADLLKEGKNVIAVDSHSYMRSTANNTFDLQATWQNN
ncbi:hypothetical protein GCM10009794_09530 [Rothia terrae]|uniref:fibrinogen-like YCDxxxxGGGW domain-containing protein n=1 Tax=Rothia terrae TaxID=396015 RepID=UPI001B35189E|nr:fibrinogen-like YCDxxxxGGGW domain-containing protein [Rothia terrae]